MEERQESTTRAALAMQQRKASMPRSDPSPFESTVGLDESKWETSPSRTPAGGPQRDEIGADVDDDGDGGKGVLGLLYQFQKAQSDGRPGVNI